MKIFALNIVLALIYAGMRGSIEPLILLEGFVLGYLCMWLPLGIPGAVGYRKQVWRVVSFSAFYVWELVLSSFRVAYDVLTPRFHMQPGVVGVPLDARTDAEITTFANLISLTPGTLSMEVSPDRRTLYVHAMYVDGEDVPAFRADLKRRFEQRVLKMMRGSEKAEQRLARIRYGEVEPGSADAPPRRRRFRRRA